MRFLLSMLSVSISMVLLATFLPLSAWAQSQSQSSISSSSSSSGAVYSLSNDPTNNAVLVFSASAGGALQCVTSVLTGGSGPNVGSGDPLHSQGSIVISDNFLFAVNAGSNTLSQFAINPQNPTQITFVSQQQTGFSYPISATAFGGYVCTLNTGASSGIGCFTYNAAGLAQLPSWSRTIALGQTTPPTASLATASQISFSPDGKSLLVSIKTTSNGFLIYPITNGQLSLTPSQYTPTGAAAPFGFSFVGSDGIFLVDPGNSQANIFSFNSANGLSDANAVSAITINSTNVKAACWAASSTKTGSVYGIGGGGGLIEIAVDPISFSASVVQYINSNGAGMLDGSVINLGGVDYLITISPGKQQILTFALLAAGRVIELNPVNLPAGLTSQVQGMAVFPLPTTTSNNNQNSGNNNNAGTGTSTSTTSTNGQTVININFQGLFQGLQL